ncbi:MAG: UDP-N-acetylmuramate--L-alanine ligase [Candidatus Nanopelagicales bacterium]|jgi:UDP-N-acetylmuramate--alanine ligase|nr:UDP-N-acetylmuramate--L-alanine ligase [Candidatus Nanopelagicales bacterium]MDP4666893.1 UDP-N-acetylmuramate--L-alanine ligase [Candidatus Nanopelagicales bacterium]MDP4895753.1 UDP-N-acetylmuramate--L-alanine ligase [Candidatus Nanopelagicales bacterium]
MTYLNSRVHVIGIGGAGMSGIARVLLARGVEVSGSDAKDSRRLQALKPLGAKVYVGHDENQLEISGTLPSCVVVSTAIGTDNSEVLRAMELGIPVINRATALAELLIGSTTISVAGTHGKTTTTSMVTVILQHAGKDPSFVIGSEMNESGSNAHQGTGELFVVEADESDGTFLVLPTTFAIVTNVEADHLNYWETYSAIEQAFVDFMMGTKSNGGSSIVCGDDAGAREVAKRAAKLGAKIISYGQGPENDAVLTLLPSGSVGSEFTIRYRDQTHGPIKLLVPGVHNALNATAAFIAALEQGCTSQDCVAGLESFTGTHRRFEFRGEVNGVRVFDDYAHHPTEIDAVLRAARSVVGSGRVLAAFQAHHYYRTALFSKEFGQALGLADFVVVLEVFAPGETPIPGASGSTMANNVPLSPQQVVFEPSWSQVAGHLTTHAKPGDIIMTLGAGDIGMMCPEILALLDSK